MLITNVRPGRTLHKSLIFWTLALLLVLLMLAGGGSRDDIQSLAFLRPAAMFALGVALWAMRPTDLRPYGVLIGLLGCSIGLAFLQLLPLPPGIWESLPGRDLLVQAAHAIGQAERWRPISIAPFRTLNAAFALLTSLAVALLVARLDEPGRYRLLYIILPLGLVSALLGLLQSIGPADSFLYFYRVTNPGSAVGLFANRNHQAALIACLFPMLSVFASTGASSPEAARLRLWLALAAGAALVPLLMVTGSRLGIGLGVLGLAATPFLYSRQAFSQKPKRKVRRFNPAIVAGSIAVLLLAALTILFSRARAFERLSNTESVGELRWLVVRPILDMISHTLPVGTGLGTFVESYQIIEPRALLGTAYLNHAHDDLLEVALTGGLPALLLIAAALAAWLVGAYKLFGPRRPHGSSATLGRLGAVITGLLALASLVDYPLRVPSMAGLFVVAGMWMLAALNGQAMHSTKSSNPPA